jgi:hypothetical protein
VEASLEGWDIQRFDDVEWMPWGGAGADARAKMLGTADGFYLALIEASPGYRGDAHEHAHPEFLAVLDGEIQNQGQILKKGDGYAAAPGSTHTDFSTETGATYLLVFKI